MYLEHYSFSEKPFTIAPNPRFLFLSTNHKEVFAHLLFGIQSRCGFIEVTGEVGTGKTTVLRTLFNQFEDDSYRLAFIFNPSLSATELLRSINREYGIDADGACNDELLCALNDFLLKENTAGRTVVLVIDEAQNLEPSVLEQVRLLSNLETETDKLIQVVLVGQPELEDILARSELRQLSQRIAVRYRLSAMDFDDTRAYLSHRLGIAGCGGEIFTPRAIRMIFRYSRGVPRLINILGDRALLVGYAEGEHRVTGSMVRTAIAELAQRRQGLWTARFWAVLVAIGIIFGGLSFYFGAGIATKKMVAEVIRVPIDSSAAPDEVAASTAAETSASDPTVGVLSHAGGNLAADLELLRHQLGELDGQENLAQAVAALQKSWNLEPVPGAGEPSDMGEVTNMLRKRGLKLTVLHGDFDSLLKFDSPALLEVLIPGFAGRRYLAVTGLAAGQALVSPALEGRPTIELNVLRRLWSGRAYVSWKNFQDIPSVAVPDSRGDEVARLQKLLDQAGVYDGPVNGIYDRSTISAVVRFQAHRGIVQDGRVGPRTLLLLYQAAGSYGAPVLSEAPAGGGR